MVYCCTGENVQVNEKQYFFLVYSVFFLYYDENFACVPFDTNNLIVSTLTGSPMKFDGTV